MFQVSTVQQAATRAVANGPKFGATAESYVAVTAPPVSVQQRILAAPFVPVTPQTFPTLPAALAAAAKLAAGIGGGNVTIKEI